jgi:MFS family permease
VTVDETPAARTTYLAVFRNREFSALWLAEALSVAGDQLARLALSLLVYDRTGSPALTGLTYALTFVPALFSGSLLSGLADRYPRRTVMVCCDIVSALLVGAIAIPGTPIALVCVGVIGMTMSNTLFKTARLALLPDVLSGDAYVVGMALRSMTQQTAQLAGFGLGGVLVAAINPGVGLAVDAVTFALSATLVGLGTRHRPASRSQQPGQRHSLVGTMTEGVRIIWRDPLLRACTLFDWLIGLYSCRRRWPLRMPTTSAARRRRSACCWRRYRPGAWSATSSTAGSCRTRGVPGWSYRWCC